MINVYIINAILFQKNQYRKNLLLIHELKKVLKGKKLFFKIIFLDLHTIFSRINQNLKSFFLFILKALFFHFKISLPIACFTVFAVKLCVFFKVFFVYNHSKAKLEIISDQVLFNVFSIKNDFFCLKASKMIEI
jgi:hypothetical protein